MTQRAARSRLGWSWSLAPSGALAAAAVVAVLLLAHHPRSTELGLQQVSGGDLEILLGNEDLAMLDDDIDFYSWLEEQPDFVPPAATAMAWADAANSGGLDRRALLRARSRGQAAARAVAAAAAGGAEELAAEDAAVPDLAFLEYLGSWQGDDDEWLAIKEWDQDAAPKGKPPDAAAKPPAPPVKPKEPAPQQAGNDHEKAQ